MIPGHGHASITLDPSSFKSTRPTFRSVFSFIDRTLMTVLHPVCVKDQIHGEMDTGNPGHSRGRVVDNGSVGHAVSKSSCQTA